MRSRFNIRETAIKLLNSLSWFASSEFPHELFIKLDINLNEEKMVRIFQLNDKRILLAKVWISEISFAYFLNHIFEFSYAKNLIDKYLSFSSYELFVLIKYYELTQELLFQFPIKLNERKISRWYNRKYSDVIKAFSGNKSDAEIYIKSLLSLLSISLPENLKIFSSVMKILTSELPFIEEKVKEEIQLFHLIRYIVSLYNFLS